MFPARRIRAPICRGACAVDLSLSKSVGERAKSVSVNALNVANQQGAAG